MKQICAVIALLVVTAGQAPGSNPGRSMTAAGAAPEPARCGTVDHEATEKLADVEFPGIIPNRGLAPEDFADGGLKIEVDPSMLLITDDPVGVVERAMRNWTIPGTYIRFQIVGPGEGGNLIHAENIRQAARATVGRPGWGADAFLDMILDVPFSRGDESLVAVITHEMGHWLGFDHSFLGSTVMFPVLTDRINWVDPDQAIKAMVRYGDQPNSLAEIRGRVTRGGVGLSGARINLLGSNGRTAFGTFADPQGFYHAAVCAGTYRMIVDPNDGPAVDGNFIGTYPGGPLDFVTVEAASEITVDAGDVETADLDVPVGGDTSFKITTAEPTTCSPGGGTQAVSIYYEGADIDEIASVEALSDDVTIFQVTNVGGIMEAFFDVDRDALPGPRAFLVRKTNGTFTIVPGVVGIVAPLRLETPPYALPAAAGEPIVVSWIDLVPRGSVAQFVASVSQDGGQVWTEIGRATPQQSSLEWTPDAELETSALRFRIEALDAIGAVLAVDETIANIGLGLPARGAPADGRTRSVRLLSPNGGESLISGDAARVSWTVANPDGVVSQVVEASLDGGQRWEAVGSAGPTARSIEWTPDARPSDDVIVRVTVTDAGGGAVSDASDGTLRLRARPVIDGVSVKVKGANFVLKVRGSGFEPGAVVRMNDEIVAVPITVSASGGQIKLKADAAALHLKPPGQRNRIVVEVDGLVSAEATFVH